MNIRILAVEDDERILTAVTFALEDEGWQVIKADSGEVALTEFRKDIIDLVLIDIMLPGIDGFELCREIRNISDVPIIMVTARDDYLTKPFAPKELSARIRALLRRSRSDSTNEPLLRVGDLELNRDEGVVSLGDKKIHLTRTEFHLLYELAENPNKVRSREYLLEKVWGYGYFGDGRLVDVHVRRLRTKIEVDAASPQYVVTVRGMGYKLHH